MSSSCERCQEMDHEMHALRCSIEKMHCDQDCLAAKLAALMKEFKVLQCELEKSKDTIELKTATNDKLGKEIMDFHEKNVKLEAENKEMKRKVEEMEALMKAM